MKNLKLFFCLFLTSLFMASCGHHRDGTSVWAEGLWLIVAAPAIGAAAFFWAAYKASRSGSSTTDVYSPGGVKYSDENVPIYKVNLFWFGVALVIACIVIIAMVNGDKG